MRVEVGYVNDLVHEVIGCTGRRLPIPALACRESRAGHRAKKPIPPFFVGLVREVQEPVDEILHEVHHAVGESTGRSISGESRERLMSEISYDLPAEIRKQGRSPNYWP